jgi:hypothetical protein
MIATTDHPKRVFINIAKRNNMKPERVDCITRKQALA